MIKYFFASALFMLTTAAHAQKRELPIKDTAYARFKTELDGWIKKAGRRNTYATEVKALFERNKPMLSRIYRQNGSPVIANNLNAAKPRQTLFKPSPEVLKMMNELQIFGTEKNVAPDAFWMYHDLTNPQMSQFPLISDSDDAGEISYTLRYISVWEGNLFQSQRGVSVKIEVPDHPQVIFARIKLDYTFDYTGWDTYGGRSGINLVLLMNPKFKSSFHSETLMNWMDTVVTAPVWKFQHITYPIIENLMPYDSIAGEFGEVHVSKQGSVYADGYVNPNTSFSLGIGFGYMKDSYVGANGHYLYGEFRLKKATVSFYKKKPV